MSSFRFLKKSISYLLLRFWKKISYGFTGVFLAQRMKKKLKKTDFRNVFMALNKIFVKKNGRYTLVFLKKKIAKIRILSVILKKWFVAKKGRYTCVNSR